MATDGKDGIGTKVQFAEAATGPWHDLNAFDPQTDRYQRFLQINSDGSITSGAPFERGSGGGAGAVETDDVTIEGDGSTGDKIRLKDGGVGDDQLSSDVKESLVSAYSGEDGIEIDPLTKKIGIQDNGIVEAKLSSALRTKIDTDADTTYTDAEIKTKYLANSDTNNFDDAAKAKVAGIRSRRAGQSEAHRSIPRSRRQSAQQSRRRNRVSSKPIIRNGNQDHPIRSRRSAYPRRCSA